jgi:hypothetical protein
MRRSPKVAEVLPVVYLRGAVHRRPPPGEPNGLAAGTKVTVTADDYAFDPVAGTLAAATADDVAIRRSDPALGAMVVHFPRFGFRVAPAG